MACADLDTLMALVEDSLPEAVRQEIAIHAASCERCHALIDGLLETGDPDEAPSVPATVGPGTVIGRYVIGERLGAGGMGVVYAALDSELHRRVAVKLVRADRHRALGTQGQERLLREARVLARLSHPNVVTVFDVGSYDDGVFLAMELVDGGDLNAWLRRARRPLPGPLEGNFAATRRDPSAPFPPGQRLAGRARNYDYVTGVSADGLSLFMSSEFATHVLVRTTTSEPFGDPGVNVTPAMLPGWRAIPVEGCNRIITTWTPGGCVSEQAVWLEGESSR